MFSYYWAQILIFLLQQMQEAKRIAQAQSMLPNGDMKVKMEV